MDVVSRLGDFAWAHDVRLSALVGARAQSQSRPDERARCHECERDTDVAVPAPLARELQLERGAPVQLQTANGVVNGFATRLARVRIGAIEQTQVRAHINPSMNGDEVLLGMSFLRRLEFTQRGDTLVLRQWTQ